MADGTSAVIHVNRLKKAHQSMRGKDVVPHENRHEGTTRQENLTRLFLEAIMMIVT
jgi:hypothetical protein